MKHREELRSQRERDRKIDIHHYRRLKFRDKKLHDTPNINIYYTAMSVFIGVFASPCQGSFHNNGQFPNASPFNMLWNEEELAIILDPVSKAGWLARLHK